MAWHLWIFSKNEGWIIYDDSMNTKEIITNIKKFLLDSFLDIKKLQEFKRLNIGNKDNSNIIITKLNSQYLNYDELDNCDEVYAFAFDWLNIIIDWQKELFTIEIHTSESWELITAYLVA